MPLIVVVSGSPAPGSRSLAVGRHVGAELSRRGFGVASIDVRDLPPEQTVALLPTGIEASAHGGTQAAPRSRLRQWRILQ